VTRWWPLLLAFACHTRTAPLAPAGSGAADDGAGELARWSSRILTSDEPEAPAAEQRRHRGGDDYVDPNGGAAYGGAAYGGAAYANYRPPVWNYTSPNRQPHYATATALTGSIEGTVSWAGAPPPKVTTACGAIDNPSLRVNNHVVEGVLVYVERVAVGRAVTTYGRPTTVGGAVMKHGCTLTPAIQIATPLPSMLSVHGDTARSRIKVTPPNGAPKLFDLQEAGRAQLPIGGGLTRVEADDGKLSSAWVLALDTPYYAMTDADGHFRLDELAPGSYDIMFWQPPLAASTPEGRFIYGPPVLVRRSATVGPKPARLDVTLGK